MPYDSLADGYDTHIRRVVPGYDLVHRITGAYLKTLLPTDTNVLVIGTGTGNDLLSLNSIQPDWNLTGIEPSPAMFRIASAKVKSLATDRISLMNSRLEDYRPQRTFDACSLSLVLQLVVGEEAKLEFLRLIRSFIRKGGSIALIDTCRCDDPTLRALAAHNEQAGMPHDEALEDVFALASRFDLVTPTEVEHLAAKAGFGSVRRVFQAFVTFGWIVH
jgi:tRNA (cmo5U34)-methyltransferase